MATPKKINIEFNATGNLKDAIKAIAKEYQKFQKQSNEVSKATKKLSNEQKFSAEILKDISRRNKQQTQEDVERVAALKKKAIAEKKAAEAAKKHAKAQKILAINADVNKKRIRQLNESLKKVGKSFRDTAITTDVLKRAMKGNAAAMSAVNKASKHLLSTTKKLKTGLFNISNDGRLLSNTFATLRSKMLLVAFAATTITTLFVNQVRAFGRQEASVKRLADVFGNQAAKRLDEFSSALQRNSTFGDENINIVMSQIGAFGASEEQTKKLMQATIDLSAGIGIDLNSAGLLVAKTIGSSTDALTRYGVGADGAKEKNEKIANVIKSVEEKFGGLGKMLSQTTEGQLAQAANAFGDFQENIGEALAPTVLFLANTLKVLSQALNTRVIKLFIKSIIVLTSALIAQRAILIAQTKATIAYKIATMSLTRATRLATVAFGRFSQSVAKNKIGVFIAVMGGAIVAFNEFFRSTDDADEELKDFKKNLNDLTEGSLEHTKSILENTKNLKKQLALLNATSEVEKMEIELKRKLTAEEKLLVEQIRNKKAALEATKRLEEDQVKRQSDILDIIERVNGAEEDAALTKLKVERDLVQSEIKRLEAEKELEELMGGSILLNKITNNQLEKLRETYDKLTESINNYGQETIDINTLLLEETGEFFAAISEISQQSADSRINNINSVMNEEINALKKTRSFKKMSDSRQAEEEQKIREKHEKRKAKVRKEANRVMLLDFRFRQAMSIKDAVISTKTAYNAALSRPPAPNIPLAVLAASLGAVQVAAIAAQKPPKMERGGLIGGRRHSQGGTMIEAEQGEFVINRNAVDAIGVENLNRMNRGGGAPISISFTGNVMSDDFIENEAIPKIKEAVRRGSDIGVS